MNITAGDRVRCVRMPDDPNPVPPGTLGTVRGEIYAGEGLMLIPVHWDNGRTLNLCVPPDQYDRVEQ